MYKPHSVNTFGFIRELDRFLRCNAKNDCEFFVGDLNINILGHSDECLEYLNTLYEYGFVSLINKVTRVENNSRTCIDHIFLKDKTLTRENLTPIVLHSSITDHFPIMISYQKPYITLSEKAKTIEIVKTDIKKLKKLATEQNFNTVYSSDNVDDATANFFQILDKITAQSTDIIRYHAKPKKKKWITAGIIRSIKVRDKLYREYKKYNSADTLKNYKHYRNKINSLIIRERILSFFTFTGSSKRMQNLLRSA